MNASTIVQLHKPKATLNDLIKYCKQNGIEWPSAKRCSVRGWVIA